MPKAGNTQVSSSIWSAADSAQGNIVQRRALYGAFRP